MSNEELISLHSQLLEVKKVRIFSTSIGYPILDPTIIYEDNQAHKYANGVPPMSIPNELEK
eukprot:6801040-Ditylum_brightwellii.AAC.1